MRIPHPLHLHLHRPNKIGNVLAFLPAFCLCVQGGVTNRPLEGATTVQPQLIFVVGWGTEVPIVSQNCVYFDQAS